MQRLENRHIYYTKDRKSHYFILKELHETTDETKAKRPTPPQFRPFNLMSHVSSLLTKRYII